MLKTSEAAAGAGRTGAGGAGRLGVVRWVAVALVVVLLVIAAYFAYERLVAAEPPPTPPQTVTVRRGPIVSSVSSTGTVAPLTMARLAFRASGRVAEVDVKQGDAVAKGQVLAKLDTTDLELQTSQAKAQYSTAQAKLANVKAGSRAEDIRAAQAQLDAARSKLDAMLAGSRPEDVASAKAALDSAKARLNQLRSVPLESDVRAAEQGVAAAQSALQKAQADLARLKAGPGEPDLRSAQIAVEQAKTSLWAQQTSRDGTCGNPLNKPYQCDAANAQVSAAEMAVSVAQNNLAKLQAPPRSEDVAAAEQAAAAAQAQITAAQSKLAQVKAGTSANDLAAAEATVVQAEQALALKQKPFTDADLQAQRQAIAVAEANLAAKQAPYTDADVQSAQAGVDQAQAALDLAQYNLANGAIVAPFDGVVSAVGVSAGEATASPAFVLVNPKEVRLDVNVDETDVGRVQAGQAATVTFDALPGRSFAGKVIAVAPNAVIQSGVATYLVSISIAEPGPIKPGMTGNASIVYSEQPNALMVPNRVIRTQGRNRVVEVLVGEQRETRQVKVGVANDQMSEIVEGVAEGEQVIISSTTSFVPGVRPAGGQTAPAPKPAGS